jgi:3-methyladenine DNA glycosylase Tag
VYSKIEIQKIKRVGSDTSKEVWNDAHVLKNRQWLSSVRDNARADP